MRSKIRTPPSLESSINFDVISVVIIWCRLRHRLREPASIDGQVGKYWQVLILHVKSMVGKCRWARGCCIHVFLIISVRDSLGLGAWNWPEKGKSVQSNPDKETTTSGNFSCGRTKYALSIYFPFEITGNNDNPPFFLPSNYCLLQTELL
jgi:hypothetical protein